MQNLIYSLIQKLGDDPNRPELKKTPARVAKAFSYLTEGYNQKLEKIVNNALFTAESDNMVILKNIEFYSLCEHHMLPFFGKCHIGYIPRKKIIGLSKLPRIIDMFSHRLQVQERLTEQVARAIEEAVNPRGVGVVMSAQHLCMMMRGVEKQSSTTITSAMRGIFREDEKTRAEFLGLIK